MAKFKTLSVGEEAAWQKWVKSRPEIVRDAITKHNLRPDTLYRLKPSNHRVYLYSVSEDGTVTVVVSGEYNRVVFGRQVFGINPADLMECDLPAPGEDVGDTSREAGYTDDDIRNILIPRLRDDLATGGRAHEHGRDRERL